MINIVETGSDVPFNHPLITLGGELVDLGDGILSPTFRPIPVAMRVEIGPGGGGNNGQAVATLLAAQGKPVWVVSRSPEDLSSAGTETGFFDFQVPETYAPALERVDKIYLIVPEDMADGPARAEEFLRAAVEAGARRVVVLSARGVDEFTGHPLLLVEESVRSLVPEWAILRCNWFMHNFSDGFFARNILENDCIAAPTGFGTVSFVNVARRCIITLSGTIPEGYCKLST